MSEKGEKGQVVELLSGGYVSVRIERSEACAKCGACELAGQHMLIKAKNPDHARVSDWVDLELAPKRFLAASLILYGIPLLALIAGAAIGYYIGLALGMGEGASLIGFLLGVALTAVVYLIIHWNEKTRKKKSAYMPIAHLGEA